MEIKKIFDNHIIFYDMDNEVLTIEDLIGDKYPSKGFLDISGKEYIREIAQAILRLVDKR